MLKSMNDLHIKKNFMSLKLNKIKKQNKLKKLQKKIIYFLSHVNEMLMVVSYLICTFMGLIINFFINKDNSLVKKNSWVNNIIIYLEDKNLLSFAISCVFSLIASYFISKSLICSLLCLGFVFILDKILEIQSNNKIHGLIFIHIISIIFMLILYWPMALCWIVSSILFSFLIIIANVINPEKTLSLIQFLTVAAFCATFSLLFRKIIIIFNTIIYIVFIVFLVMSIIFILKKYNISLKSITFIISMMSFFK